MDILLKTPSQSRRTLLQAAVAAGFGALTLGAPGVSLAAPTRSTLQARVNAHVRAQRRAGRISRDEQTSWSIYDFTTGGCRDGLHPDRVSANQGAESTLAWLLSLLEFSQTPVHDSESSQNPVEERHRV